MDRLSMARESREGGLTLLQRFSEGQRRSPACRMSSRPALVPRTDAPAETSACACASDRIPPDAFTPIEGWSVARSRETASGVAPGALTPGAVLTNAGGPWFLT